VWDASRVDRSDGAIRKDVSRVDRSNGLIRKDASRVHWSDMKKQVEKIRFRDLFLTEKEKNRSVGKKQSK